MWVKGLPPGGDTVYEVRCERPGWSASAGTFRADARGRAVRRADDRGAARRVREHPRRAPLRHDRRPVRKHQLRGSRACDRSFIALALATALLAGCGGDDEEPAATPEPAAEATRGARRLGGGETVKVSSPADGSLKFDQATLTAKAGKVTFTFANPSQVPHAFEVEGNGVEEDDRDDHRVGDASVTVDLKPGSYEYYCPVGAAPRGGDGGARSRSSERVACADDPGHRPGHDRYEVPGLRRRWPPGRAGVLRVPAVLPPRRVGRARRGRDLGGHAARRPRGARGRRDRRLRPRGHRDHEPARDRRRLGPRVRRAAAPRDRVAGPAHRRALRRAASAGARAALPRAHGARARRLLLRHEVRVDAAPRAAWTRAPRSARSTRGWSSSSAAGTSRTTPTPPARCCSTSASSAGTRSCASCSACPSARCPSRSATPSSTARRPSSAAACPSAGWPATSRRRSTARAATRRGSGRTRTAPGTSCSSTPARARRCSSRA